MSSKAKEESSRSNLLPHHATSISLESNLGVPCWTDDELRAMPRDSWPPCTHCGKPDSSLFCPKCVEWKLPKEIYCSRECLEAQYANHVERLHKPEGEWVTAKKYVNEKTTGEQHDVVMRLLDSFQELYAHPRDRNDARNRGGQMGREWVQQAKGLAD